MTKQIIRKNGEILFLVIVIFILFEICDAYLNTLERVEGKHQQVSKDIVYDISGLLRSKQTFVSNKTLSDVFSDGGGSLFYYEGNTTLFKNIWMDSLTRPGQKNVPGIAFMVFGNTTNLMNIAINPVTDKTPFVLKNMNSSVLHSVVTSVYVSHCRCYLRGSDINDHINNIVRRTGFSKETKRSIKLGFEYSDHYLICCRDKNHDALKLVDYTILRVEASPLMTMLSYGIFSEMMTDLVATNRQFVRRFNSNCAIYVRMVSTNWNNTVNNASMDRYRALHVQYLSAWIGESDGKEKYILQPFPKDYIPVNRQFVNKNVISPIFTQNMVYWSNDYRNEVACIPQEIVKIYRQAFSNILLDNPSSTFVNLMLKRCKFSNMTTVELLKNERANTSVLTTLLFGIYDENFELLLNSSSSINIQAVYIQPTHVRDSLYSKNFIHNSFDTLRTKRFKIGCAVFNTRWLIKEVFEGNTSSFVQTLTKECGVDLFNASAEILYQFKLKIEMKEDLLQILRQLQEIKQVFEQVNPGKTFTPMINVVLFPGKNSNKAGAQFIYCNSNSKLQNEYQQTIISFANIHQWEKLIFYDNFKELYGFWKCACPAAYYKVFGKNYRIPAIFRSNVEKSLGNSDLPYTFPCIQWTKAANSPGINFMANQFCGATLDLNLKQNSLNEEMKTTLLIALGKFSQAEMIVGDAHSIQEGLEVLSPKMLKEIQTFRKNHSTILPLVYMEVLLADIYVVKSHWSESLTKGLVGLHLRDWEIENNSKLPYEFFEKNFIQNLGITVQNCDDGIKHKVFEISKLTNMSFSKMLNYVVCNVDPIEPNNFDSVRMEKYFQNLYYIKANMEYFLPLQIGTTRKIEVMFRINVIPMKRPCPVAESPEQNSFLRFLNDVSQHSATYKIRYFIVRAFENENSTESCPYTWWHIRNYTDLTNLSVYTDTEAEYFGRPTKLIISTLPPLPQNVDSFNNDHIYYFIVLPVVTTAAVLLIILMWLRMHYSKKRLLTSKEIKQFYNGREVTGNEMEMVTTDFLASIYMKFEKSHEVPMEDIELGELVGSGQFGLVHKGMILSKQLEAAVKIPRSDCGKEQFLSTLSELKILGYIGSHPNIVSFLGAHTKRIAVGKLYILTEFCEKGSLLGFLRNVQSEHAGSSSTQEVDMHQLHTFSYQIALGMEYVSQKRVIHGDLAARNVLLTSCYTCKVADFGLSRRLYELYEYKKTSKVPLPWRWMAPESLGNLTFTSMSDVWSYGITLWEIFSLGKIPYPNKGWTEDFMIELENGTRMGKADYVTDDVHNKILDCWKRNQKQRPTFSEMKEFFGEQISAKYLNLEEMKTV